MTIFVPSLNRERQTVIYRLDLNPDTVEAVEDYFRQNPFQADQMTTDDGGDDQGERQTTDNDLAKGAGGDDVGSSVAAVVPDESDSQPAVLGKRL